ncbi:MAG: putative sulfate/molybdate transporter [Candidatus Hermodarchaeota archaeon]
MNSEEVHESDSKLPIKKKFSIRELGGAFGDWGTLIPFIIGYVSIVGLNPAGIFLTLGITNIILGVRFNLPLPVQPQKTIGAIALSQKWDPNLVISTGLGTGIIWTILGLTKTLNKIVKKIPIITVRGIQLGLGLILGWTAITLIFYDNFFGILLGIISISIIIALINSKKVPSAIILVLLGIGILIFTNKLTISNVRFSLPIFEFNIPQWDNLLIGMVLAGIAQLFLTLTNVMIATISLIKDLFPEKENEISANSLAVNMGLMNLINPFLGGMPLCHGSGGLAAQYAFGARSGGSMILEGILEIFLGLFFSETLFLLFIEFPQAIFGAMLLYTSYLLIRISFKDYKLKSLPIIITSGMICIIFHIIFKNSIIGPFSIILGFFVGLILYLIFSKRLN